jgi:hypothetical protein
LEYAKGQGTREKYALLGRHFEFSSTRSFGCVLFQEHELDSAAALFSLDSGVRYLWEGREENEVVVGRRPDSNSVKILWHLLFIKHDYLRYPSQELSGCLMKCSHFGTKSMHILS